jgi:hypothetical protein
MQKINVRRGLLRDFMGDPMIPFSLESGNASKPMLSSLYGATAL